MYIKNSFQKSIKIYQLLDFKFSEMNKKSEVNETLTLITEKFLTAKIANTCDICFWEPEKITQEHIRVKKIKILLREPWERAFLMWKWMLQEGLEWIDRFDVAVSLERKRYFEQNDYKIKTHIWNYMYFTAGRYSIFISRMKEITRKAIELSFSHLSEMPYFETNIPLNTKLQFALHNLSEIIKSFSPKYAIPIEIMKKINIKLGRKITTHWCKDFLKEAYRKDVEILSQITGVDFYSLWYNKEQ